MGWCAYWRYLSKSASTDSTWQLGHASSKQSSSRTRERIRWREVAITSTFDMYSLTATTQHLQLQGLTPRASGLSRGPWTGSAAWRSPSPLPPGSTHPGSRTPVQGLQLSIDVLELSVGVFRVECWVLRDKGSRVRGSRTPGVAVEGLACCHPRVTH